MKIKVDVECTPQEARSFLGLPDMEPVHKLYIERMETFVRDGLTAADIESMIRSWMPFFEGGMEAWNKAVRQMTGGSSDKN